MGDINSKNGLNVNGEDIQPLDIEDVAADFVPLSLNDDKKELLEEDLKEIMEDDIQEEASPDAVIEFDEIPNDGDVDDVDMEEVSPFDSESTEQVPESTYCPAYVPGDDKAKQFPSENQASGIKFWKTVGLSALCGLVMGLTSLGVTSFAPGNNDSSKPTVSVGDFDAGPVEIVESPELAQIETSITKVVDEAMPSVVAITNMSVQEVKDFFFGTVEQYENESTGSGVIIGQNDDELLILTNNHVIEGNTSLTVQFIDGEIVEAVVKGTDSDIDLAVVSVPKNQIKDSTSKEIKVAVVGDSTRLNVGEPTIAIGNALGYGQSVTTGIISATDKDMEGFSSKLIQTDAAINPGNSGGALLNIRGELIGINTAKLADTAVEGMGYAISITDVKETINTLVNKKTRQKVAEEYRGVLGISGTDVDGWSAAIYGMPQGVYVSEVQDDGAADKAGLKKGNIILSFDGSVISNMTNLKTILQYYEAGEKVEIKYAALNSDGEYEAKFVEVTLGGNRKNTFGVY